MKFTPQFRLAGSLVMLLLCVALIGDTLGFLPRSQDQLRETRKVMGEALAVQLSAAAATGNNDVIAKTLESVVERNREVVFGGLALTGGAVLAEFGERPENDRRFFDFSTTDSLIVPIFDVKGPWGEVTLEFQPTKDLGLRYIGFPTKSLTFIAFLCIACLATFYLFLRKALKELNPTKAVPERVHSAFEVLAEGVLIIDEKHNIVLANKSFAKRVKQNPEDLVGTSPSDYDWDLSGEEGQEFPWQSALTQGEHVMGMHMRLTVEGQEISFAVNAAPILGEGSHSRGVLITFDDVSPLEAKNTELAKMLSELNETQRVIESKNEELETLATRDSLTGFLNRRSFMEFYSNHFETAREQGMDLAVLMVDIDHFKAVNDNFGHLVGDQAIIVVAQALEDFFRKNDYVGRYGGEEFVVSMPGAAYQEAFKAADEVREHISTLVSTTDLPMEKLTVSIGLAVFNEHVQSDIELIDMADRGLYKAKQTGRNQVCLFDPDYTSLPEDPATATDKVNSTGTHELRVNLQMMKDRVQEQAKELTYRTMHDDLTRLPNRFLLIDRISQAVKRTHRTGTVGAVISVSVSAYQRIFDQEGHEGAEELMLRCAEVVQSVIREGDSVSALEEEQAVTCSRISHNELALLAVDVEDVPSVAKIVDRITSALERAVNIQGQDVYSLVYCGLSLFPIDSEEPEVLIRNASLARKFAKRRSGPRSGHAYFSKDIDAKAIQDAHIAGELHKVIAEGGLRLVYQPKVDTHTREVAGVEALVRWHHEELGDIGPQDFVEVAEKIGVIDKLTNWVMGQVCRDIEAGLLGEVRVSVNVSPVELGDANTAKRLLGIVAGYNVQPTQVEIEVTESSFVEDFKLGQDILLEFREAGVLISLDDFGTGFSSLSMLTQIPVDIIKIDRCFISNIHQAKTNHAIVSAILQMSRSLGMRVVAEGVSNDEEYECVKLLGCKESQGYYFARPMPVEEFGPYCLEHGTVERRVDLTGQFDTGLQRLS